MALTFKKATREQAKARVALIGPSGSGKTYSALLIAHSLGGRVAVIDTEHGSASKYAGRVDPRSELRFDFDVLELDSFSPDTYCDAITAAAKAGFDVLVIDSLSHAWMGKDGALDMVDKAAKRSQSGNSFAAWRDVTPKHNRLVEALVSCPLHLIVTMRSKMEYVLEQVERNGKTVTQPRKVGLAPIQRDGLEYEFDVVGDIDLDHNWAISKTRCPDFDGALIERPGVDFAQTYRAWLSDGAAPAPKPEPKPKAAAAKPKPEGNGGNASAAAAARRPLFGSKLQWEGAEQWAGKPLADAPLETLLQYLDAGNAAREAASDPRDAWLLKEHLTVVEAELARKEPKVEREPEPAAGEAAA